MIAAPTSAAVAALARFADDLGAVFSADDPVAAVNRLLADVRVHPRISTHDGRSPHLHFESPGAGVAERLEVNVLLALASLLCDDHLRLGRCEAEGCARPLVDVSRNARRRFCGAACANRTHVAAHRARQRGGRHARSATR